MKEIFIRSLGSLLVLGMILVPVYSRAAVVQATAVRHIVFPAIGITHFSNDWHAPRSGHLHQGNDIIGKKGMSLVAAISGTVRFVAYPQPSYGYMVTIQDSAGYEYWYLHINNDNPGTDDGLGGGMHAYAPGIEDGATVKAGQLIGWMGDSGDAEATVSHLHFEMHDPSGTAMNPYSTLLAAQHISTSVAPDPQVGELFPFAGFTGGASVAVGDVYPNIPGEELVVGAGPGGGPQVRVYSSSGAVLSQFFAYPRSFRGGVDVAVGDVDANGQDEIITAAGRGGGSEVNIYSSPGTLRRTIFPYPKFNGEVHIAAADLNGDGVDEIVTGAGRGGGPDVHVYSGSGDYVSHFMAYPATIRGGIDVTAISSIGNTPGVIVTTPLAGGGPHVKIFSMTGELQTQFFAYPKAFRGGVRVTNMISSSTGLPTIVTIPGGSASGDVRYFALDGTQTATTKVFEEWWQGGYDIAAGDGGSIYASVTSPSRRTTVRSVNVSRRRYLSPPSGILAD